MRVSFEQLRVAVSSGFLERRTAKHPEPVPVSERRPPPVEARTAGSRSGTGGARREEATSDEEKPADDEDEDAGQTGDPRQLVSLPSSG